MVLLFLDLTSLNSKSIESVARVTVCERNLRLAGSPVAIAQVAAQELNTAHDRKNASVKL
jgi:hypothetical protein